MDIKLTTYQKIAVEIHEHCIQHKLEWRKNKSMWVADSCKTCELGAINPNSPQLVSTYECIIGQLYYRWWNSHKKNTPLQLKAKKLLNYCYSRGCKSFTKHSECKNDCDLLSLSGQCIGYNLHHEGNYWVFPDNWKLILQEKPMDIIKPAHIPYSYSNSNID